MDCKNIITDANNLYRAYKASIRGSKWKETCQKYMLNFLSNLLLLKDSLESQTYRNGNADEFELHERGRVRPVSSLPVQDRIVRHVLCDDILLPLIQKKIIYDNGASIKRRGLHHSRKRFEIHLRRYYLKYGNEGYILFGDFSKFYDNILHDISKAQFLELVDNNSYVRWLLDIIYSEFMVDVSYMSEEEYSRCIKTCFNKIEHRKIPNTAKNGEKYMPKSVNIGDQLSQVIGVYYPHKIDNYVKYVRSQKFYGRYMDDFYIMNPSKNELNDLLEEISKIAESLGIHINQKKTRIVKIKGPYRYLQFKYELSDCGKIYKLMNTDRIFAMKRKLKKLAMKVESDEVPYENVEGMFRGWMCEFYKFMTNTQRENMLRLYEELFNKEIRIIDQKMVIEDRIKGE